MNPNIVYPRLGELHVSDVRAVMPNPAPKTIEVCVLGGNSTPSYVGYVELRQIPAGRGEHLALVCPRCRQAKSILRTDQLGLSCSSCSHHRSRRQREHTCKSWKRFDGVSEEHLLKLCGRGQLSGRQIAEANNLISILINADEDRLSELAPDIKAALTVMNT